MRIRCWGWLPVLLAFGLVLRDARPVTACCPAYPQGKPVLNADQTILILWDPTTQIEHFVRQATFAGSADDFAFLVPSPSLPELSESGDGVFPALAKITAPREVTVEIEKKRQRWCLGMGGSLSEDKSAGGAVPPNATPAVRVLEEKTVAGFNAVVLEADTVSVLVAWLSEHGYLFSPAVEAWVAPYIDGHWKITALKVDKENKAATRIAAPALRISFRTDRPLFPYREPDATEATEALNVHSRLLRIYFVGEARYDGEITATQPWTGKAAWSGPLAAEQRSQMLAQLNLPADRAPATCWLTEFEDPWPYRQAEADLYFHKAASQAKLERPPIIHYVYVEPSIFGDWLFWVVALGLIAAGWALFVRWKIKRSRSAA